MAPFDTVVDVGMADHDVLGQRGASVTRRGDRVARRRVDAGCDAPRRAQSSAMVYGAIANNPIPLTEDAVLRPDPTFVYARQLAAAEETIEEWRGAVAEPHGGDVASGCPDRRRRHVVARRGR